MNDDPNDERRSEVRSGAKVAVKFQAATEAAKAFKAFSVNVSSRGLCLRTRIPHQVGDRLMLELDIDGEQFNLKGQVAWGKEGVIGIRFVDVSPEDSKRLEGVATQLAKASPSESED